MKERKDKGSCANCDLNCLASCHSSHTSLWPCSVPLSPTHSSPAMLASQYLQTRYATCSCTCDSCWLTCCSLCLLVPYTPSPCRYLEYPAFRKNSFTPALLAPPAWVPWMPRTGNHHISIVLPRIWHRVCKSMLVKG